MLFPPTQAQAGQPRFAVVQRHFSRIVEGTHDIIWLEDEPGALSFNSRSHAARGGVWIARHGGSKEQSSLVFTSKEMHRVLRELRVLR
jgi:hypothetical protein